MSVEKIEYDIGLKHKIGNIVWYKTIIYNKGEMELKGKIIAYWKTEQKKGYIVNFKFFGGSLHLTEKEIYKKCNNIKKL